MIVGTIRDASGVELPQGADVELSVVIGPLETITCRVFLMRSDPASLVARQVCLIDHGDLGFEPLCVACPVRGRVLVHPAHFVEDGSLVSDMPTTRSITPPSRLAIRGHEL